MASRLVLPILRNSLKVDTIYPNNGKLEIVGGVSFANEIQGVNVSKADPPKEEGEMLRSVSSSKAVWKSKEVKSNDLPATGVVSGTYYLPTVSVDTKGRITSATENFVPPCSLSLQAGTGVVRLSSNKSYYAKTGKDTIQLVLDVKVLLSPNNTLVFHLNGLTHKPNTGITPHFGGFVLANGKPALVEVHYPNTLVLTLSELPKDNVIHFTGELVYQCENF